MKAILKSIRASAKKTNIVAGLIRGKDVKYSLDFLKVLPKKSAKILRKVLLSAVANAEKNNEKSVEKLIVKSIIVNKAGFYKRFLPSTRGRALPLKKPLTHITIELEEKAPKK